MIKVIKNILLFLLAEVLVTTLAPIGMIAVLFQFYYKLLNNKSQIDEIKSLPSISQYFLTLAVSKDQYGNVAMQVVFNWLLITKNGYKFGNEDETISSVLGKNKLSNTLSKTGRFLVSVLDFLDKDHSINSIEN